MLIVYTPNPLRTKIYLDEVDERLLRERIKVQELEECIGSAHYHLSGSYAEPDPQKALQALRYDWIYQEGASGLDARVDEMLKYYRDDLLAMHVGDCTCVACSCTKCHGESLLGIDTIAGLGKHSANKISDAFGFKKDASGQRTDEDLRTLDEALAYLKDYEPSKGENFDEAGWAKVGGFEAHIDRWKTEAKTAYDWLLKYKTERFAD